MKFKQIVKTNLPNYYFTNIVNVIIVNVITVNVIIVTDIMAIIIMDNIIMIIITIDNIIMAAIMVIIIKHSIILVIIKVDITDFNLFDYFVHSIHAQMDINFLYYNYRFNSICIDHYHILFTMAIIMVIITKPRIILVIIMVVIIDFNLFDYFVHSIDAQMDINLLYYNYYFNSICIYHYLNFTFKIFQLIL